MRWGIRFNWEHVAAWRYWLGRWLLFVAVCLIFGWRLGPRIDEVVFAVVTLPLVATGAYALFCVTIATLRLLLTVGRDRWLGWTVRRQRARLRGDPSGDGRCRIGERDVAVWSRHLD